MAATKGGSAITQLTASGTSTTLGVPTTYDQVLGISHSNGTGTVTAAATIQVQYQVSTAARWYPLATFTASLTAAATDSFTCLIPGPTTAVRLVYTAPTGPTGVTLDAEIGTISGL
jgi:hypothetical protein